MPSFFYTAIPRGLVAPATLILSCYQQKLTVNNRLFYNIGEHARTQYARAPIVVKHKMVPISFRQTLAVKLQSSPSVPSKQEGKRFGWGDFAKYRLFPILLKMRCFERARIRVHRTYARSSVGARAMWLACVCMPGNPVDKFADCWVSQFGKRSPPQIVIVVEDPDLGRNVLFCKTWAQVLGNESAFHCLVPTSMQESDVPGPCQPRSGL